MAAVKFLAVLALGLLLVTALPLGIFISVARAQNTSCPPSLVLRAAISGGAPTTLNMIVNPSVIAVLTNNGIEPTIGPSGQHDYNNSIADWVKANSNYTLWMVNVAPGKRWSDGTPITSADILATYSNKFAFNASYDFTGEHNLVASESALNSSTVIFTLNKTDALFPVIIGPQVLTTVAPAEAITSPSVNLFNAPNSGPWSSMNYTAGDTTMKLIRNPYYSPAPVPCEMDVSFPESTSTVANLLIGGSVDYGPIDGPSAGAILKTPNLHLWDQPGYGLIEENYNVTLYPFNTTAFRQALVYGINESAVVQQADYGYAQTAYDSEGTVPSQFPFVWNSQQMKYSYDPNTAMSLLNSIGMTKGSDGLLHFKNGTAVALKMYSNNDYASITAAGIIATDLKQLGITVNVQGVSVSNMFAWPTESRGTIYLDDNGGSIYSNAQIDALPAWDVYSVPPLASAYFMYPPNVNNEYFGNLSVIHTTTDPTAIKTALNNIQLLAAQSLPLIPVAYIDEIFAYSTSHWTNWTPFPRAWINWGAGQENGWYASLKPVGVTTTTTTTATTTTSSSTTSTTSTAQSSSSSSFSQTSSTMSSASQSSSTITSATTTSLSSSIVSSTNPSTTTVSSSSPSTINYLAIVAGVVLIVVLVAVALLALRRRPRTSAPR